MNKKTNYIAICFLLLGLTIGTVFTDYAKQLGALLADANVQSHPLSEIEGSENLATKTYVNDAISGIGGYVPTSRTISPGSGLLGGGDLTANRTLTVDSTVVRTSGDQTLAGVKTFSSAVVLSTAGTATNHAVRADRTISTGSGLSGGGNLTANRTLTVDSTVVRTTGNQTLAGIKTFSSNVVVPATPTADTHAASKGYVDSNSGGLSECVAITATQSPSTMTATCPTDYQRTSCYIANCGRYSNTTGTIWGYATCVVNRNSST